VVALPSGTTLVDAQPDAGTCSNDGAQLTCELGEIAASAAVTVSVSVRAESAGELEFPSTVSADQRDPDASNNAASLSVSVAPSADLNLAASLAPATVNVGDATDLSLTVRNDGPSDASNVHLVATLPTGTSLDDTANLAACTETPTGLDCDLGALPAGSQTDMVVPLRADDSGNLSLVITTEADEHDPEVDDNRAEAVLESHGDSGGGGGAVDPSALGALLLFGFYRAIGRRGVRGGAG
jgi:uncharacterized repeat protein (TIGR01451 family)